MPDFSLEAALRSRGFRFVAGTDEAGRGCLAGPVVAAAVVLPPDADLPLLDDSKRLTAETRELLLPEIERQAIGMGVGVCSVAEIDEINILWAALRAMHRAVERVAVAVDFVLVDGNHGIPNAPWRQEPIVRGDGRSLSIAAASVVAKVTRDRMMAGLDERFPDYGFAAHKGYATAAHYDALAFLGPCPEHRTSFRLTRSGRAA